MGRFLKKIGYFAFGVLWLSGCKKSVQQRERVVPVRVAVAVEKNVPLYLDALGTCVAYDAVDVRAQSGGRILSEHFEQGRTVERDQLLYSIDPRVYEAQVAISRGKLQETEAQLSVDRMRLDRSRSLLQRQYISRQDYDTLVAIVEQGQGRLEAARGELQRSETALDFCSVRAPVRGLAGCKLTNVGNVVDGASDPLLKILVLDPLYVDFSISENDFPRLYAYFSEKNSLDCTVQLLGDGTRAVPARLEIVNNQVTPQTGSVKLRAVLDNPNGCFWPGESVRVRVKLVQLEHAVLAPEVSVGTNERGRYVFTIGENSLAQIRPVVVGQAHGENVVFLKGLTAGERVIVEGQFLLAPGTRVSIAADAAGAAASPAAREENSGKDFPGAGSIGEQPSPTAANDNRR
ncbi:MAG: efflux RND transporter periplasmic adaptor subunit [Puniceicoccales bacterium]|jgi:multidrug efflux system membrane fusion protein|nr:efflux RND transporter periplasmic adaptor subunit [Puniceicoccales bacterium]